MYICPECAYEWNDSAPAEESDELVVKDANGNLLVDGDSVTVIKDLKVKGSSSMLKIGTKVKNIRLVEGDHNIDCKIDGFGQMKLKSEFVKRTKIVSVAAHGRQQQRSILPPIYAGLGISINFTSSPCSVANHSPNARIPPRSVA